MGRRIGFVWLTIVLPFWTVPFIFMTGTGGFRSHLTFHIIYPFVIAAAVWALWRLRQAAPGRAIRWLSTILIGLQVIALVGHLGEGYVTATNGAFHSPESLFEDSAHVAFANLALPSLMLSQLLVIVTTIVWAVQRRHARPLAMAMSSTGEQHMPPAR
jgi:hypothetical protein